MFACAKYPTHNCDCNMVTRNSLSKNENDETSPQSGGYLTVIVEKSIQ